jgi:hypothetical protein
MIAELSFSVGCAYFYEGPLWFLPKTWVFAGGIALFCNAFFVHILKLDKYQGGYGYSSG